MSQSPSLRIHPKSLLGFLNAEELTASQAHWTEAWHMSGMMGDHATESDQSIVMDLHRHNFRLWHLEDQARRMDIPDYEVAKIKHTIDAENQQRNNMTEAIDVRLVEGLDSPSSPDIPLNSETIGSIIDRLSILTLKVYHVREECERRDIDPEYANLSRKRLRVLMEQRSDLARCLDQLLSEITAGTRRVKVYRQFKLYNDPRSNPALYRKEEMPSA